MEVMTLDVLTTLTLFFSTPSLTYSLARVCCRSTCSLGQGKCYAGFFLRNFFCWPFLCKFSWWLFSTKFLLLDFSTQFLLLTFFYEISFAGFFLRNFFC